MMRIILLSVVFVFSNVALCAQNADGWRGIVPLLSSRGDVIAILGEPAVKRKGLDTYTTSTGRVDIRYARGRCGGLGQGWNVKAGTVLTIVVRPAEVILHKDLRLGTGFARGEINDDLSVEYTNRKSGVRYVMNQFDEVSTILYGPSSDDNRLRCKE